MMRSLACTIVVLPVDREVAIEFVGEFFGDWPGDYMQGVRRVGHGLGPTPGYG